MSEPKWKSIKDKPPELNGRTIWVRNKRERTLLVTADAEYWRYNGFGEGDFWAECEPPHFDAEPERPKSALAQRCEEMVRLEAEAKKPSLHDCWVRLPITVTNEIDEGTYQSTIEIPLCLILDEKKFRTYWGT